LIEINDGVRFSSRAGLMAGQLCMWCRMMDIGVHHACWLRLQALFMTASVLTATSTTAMTAITSGVFIVASRPRPLPVEWFTNEPGANVWLPHRALVSVKGETRAERCTWSEILWKWIDAHEKELGIGRPYLDKDPPHVAPIDGKEYADKRSAANARLAGLKKPSPSSNPK
jgi:hypothetical protein